MVLVVYLTGILGDVFANVGPSKLVKVARYFLGCFYKGRLVNEVADLFVHVGRG